MFAHKCKSVQGVVYSECKGKVPDLFLTWLDQPAKSIPGFPIYPPLQEFCIVRIHFSVRRHSVEQVYLGYNKKKSPQSWRMSYLSGKAEDSEKRNLLFTSLLNFRTRFAPFSEKFILWLQILLHWFSSFYVIYWPLETDGGF